MAAWGDDCNCTIVTPRSVDAYQRRSLTGETYLRFCRSLIECCSDLAGSSDAISWSSLLVRQVLADVPDVDLASVRGVVVIVHPRSEGVLVGWLEVCVHE